MKYRIVKDETTTNPYSIEYRNWGWFSGWERLSVYSFKRQRERMFYPTLEEAETALKEYLDLCERSRILKNQMKKKTVVKEFK